MAPRIETTSVAATLGTLAKLFEDAAACRESLRFPADLVEAYASALRTVHHHALHLEMRAATAEKDLAELEAVAADLDVIAYARQGEIGPREPDAFGLSGAERPAIELTAAGYEALGSPPAKTRSGVGPLRGEIVEAGGLFERRRLETMQRRIQAELDAGGAA